MSTPLLSIVIPTYNREAAMQLLLADIDVILQSHRDQVQIVICNNASTDGTNALIEHYRTRWCDALKVITRKTNIGMEGNIACSMQEGDGKYIWMLSDHQRLCISEVLNVIQRMADLEFDIGHAKVLQWTPALNAKEQVMIWEDISLQQRGALLFSLGNLSTLIFRQELGKKAAKAIFKNCIWAYPHLGVISQFNTATRFVEFDSMSILPNGSGGIKLVHDYDKISVRFRLNLHCIEELCRQAKISFARSGFFTSDYQAAFKSEILHHLLQPMASRWSSTKLLLSVIAANPWRLKAIGMFVLLGFVVVPAKLRVALANSARNGFKRRMQQQKLQNPL